MDFLIFGSDWIGLHFFCENYIPKQWPSAFWIKRSPLQMYFCGTFEYVHEIPLLDTATNFRAHRNLQFVGTEHYCSCDDCAYRTSPTRCI